MPSAAPTTALSRRRLMTMAGLAAAGALPGCSASAGTGGTATRAYCVPRGSLEAHRSLGGLPLVYEINRQRSTFHFEPAFFGQLETWLDSYRRDAGRADADQLSSYGGWTDGGTSCDSWHNAGRAFDLATVRLKGDDFVSCRYDLWQSETGSRLGTYRRRYWGLAASLHLHFAYVLTYLYNAQHANHIHVDNGRSGDQQSTLSTRSRVQVQAVQAICSYLWGRPTEITGRWDSATRASTRAALQQVGVDQDLDDSVDAWRAFLTASVQRSAG